MLHLLTALGLFITVPSIIGVFQKKEKDEIVVYLLLSLLLVSLFFAFYPYVGPFQSWFPWRGFVCKALSIAAIVLAVLISRRLEKGLIPGMMITASSLIALSTFAVMRAIY